MASTVTISKKNAAAALLVEAAKALNAGDLSVSGFACVAHKAAKAMSTSQ